MNYHTCVTNTSKPLKQANSTFHMCEKLTNNQDQTITKFSGKLTLHICVNQLNIGCEDYEISKTGSW
ncbi:MAG: hypothetical protein QW228_05225 [Candidatus Aenigmatarchaeota archaeon]